MFYSKEEKELLGRYFKYYREQQQIAFSDVIKSGICDYKTYKGIEEGIAKPSNLFYDQLLDYYNLDGNILGLYNELNLLFHELYDACEWYDNERINKIILTIKQQIKNNSFHPLIVELINTLEIIKRLYISDEYLYEKGIFEAFKLIELWNNELSSLLIEVCGISNSKTTVSLDIVLELGNHAINNDSICRFWYAQCCINQRNYIEALNIFCDLKTKYEKENNLIRIIKTVQNLYLIYRDIDDKKAYEYTEILLNYLKNEKITFSVKTPIYYNIAMYYYLNSKYGNALECFQKNYEIIKTDKALLFICTCKSRLNSLLNFKMNENKESVLYPYIHYFYLKANNKNPKELEDYILSNLIPILMNEIYEYPLWDMFNYEMSVLVKLTRNYKKYHIYNENFQKATKTAL